MKNIVTWGQNMSANIEEFVCISMGGLFSGVPPLPFWVSGYTEGIVTGLLFNNDTCLRIVFSKKKKKKKKKRTIRFSKTCYGQIHE